MNVGEALPMDADLVFVEMTNHEKGFAEHFDRIIKPTLVQIEKERLVARRKYWIRLTLSGLFYVALVGIAVLQFVENRREYFMGLIVVGIIFALILFWWIRRQKL